MLFLHPFSSLKNRKGDKNDNDNNNISTQKRIKFSNQENKFKRSHLMDPWRQKLALHVQATVTFICLHSINHLPSSVNDLEREIFQMSKLV